MTERRTTQIHDDRTLESYFIDWEAETFGLGYGSGEPYVLSALRTFFGLCPVDEKGNSQAYDYLALESGLTPTVAWLLINALGKHPVSVLEYATSPRGAWLTPQGLRVRNFVLSKTADELVEIVSSATQDNFFCRPRSCNCGPNGYVAGKLCPNPFFHNKLP